MYKVGEYITAKKSYNHVLLENNKYLVLDVEIKQYTETCFRIYYTYKADNGAAFITNECWFYTKEELRELKLNKLID